MKTIILILSLTVTAIVCRAADYHLIQSQIQDEIPTQGPVDKATVYVLLCPDQQVFVFRAFYTQQMEEIIKYFHKGSVLHYDGMGVGGFPPPQVQMQALTNLCKSKGIIFEISPTN